MKVGSCWQASVTFRNIAVRWPVLRWGSLTLWLIGTTGHCLGHLRRRLGMSSFEAINWPFSAVFGGAIHHRSNRGHCLLPPAEVRLFAVQFRCWRRTGALRKGITVGVHLFKLSELSATGATAGMSMGLSAIRLDGVYGSNHDSPCHSLLSFAWLPSWQSLM